MKLDLDELLDALADRIVTKLRSGPADLIAQGASPLGKRRHCAAVRDRVTRGDAGGCIVGRVYYLTPAALQEELAKGKVPKRVRGPRPAAVDPVAALQKELGIVLGKKK